MTSKRQQAQGALPDYMRQMVCRSLPPGPIVPGSTPVIAFGDPRNATVATLGINPSLAEFCGKEPLPGGSRLLLSGEDRRLLSLEALGLESMQDATDDHVRQLVEDCASYFERPNAFWRWFGVLQRLLVASTDDRYTYRNRGACHLDLVQWATDPVWRELTAPGTKADLLSEGVPHLRRQLEHHTSIRVVLLNGRTVVNQVRDVGLADLTDVGSLVYRPKDGAETRLYVGQSRPAADGSLNRPVTFLGWSVNLQSSPGANAKDFVEGLLAPWLEERMNLPPLNGEAAA